MGFRPVPKLLALFLAPLLLAAPPSSHPVSGLIEDVRVLRQAYESLHPGLYRYNSPAQIDHAFQSLSSAFNRPLTLQEAFVSFSLFTATIRCGHSYPNFFNQPQSITAELFQTPQRVPFYFRWINRQMVVTRDFTPDQQLPPGTRVLALDGTPTPRILERLLTVARADGANDAKRVSYLEVSGDSLYEAFDVFYPLFFPIRETLSLTVQRPGQRRTSVTVATLSYEDRIAPIRTWEAARKGGSSALFDWKILPNGAALLRMPTWALYDSKWEWKQWLDARLDEAVASHTPALILDLRGNEGGLDAGNPILSRLTDKDLALPSFKRYVRYRQISPDLAPYLDTWDRSFNDWKDAAKPLSSPPPNMPPGVSYFRLVRYDDSAQGDVIHPSGSRFTGKVILLVDASNSSATFQFAQLVQRHRLGTLIGQPTGGNRRGINGGAFFFLRLPNSKIEIDLPLIATFPDTSEPDAGLLPDILVTPKPEDIAAGRDPELLAALKFLRLP